VEMGGTMNDQRVNEVRRNPPVDRLATVGLTVAILLLAAAVVAYLV
jgi:hypothetical protein